MIERRFVAPGRRQTLHQQHVGAFVERSSFDRELGQTQRALVLLGGYCVNRLLADKRVDEPPNSLAFYRQPGGEPGTASRLQPFQ